MMSFIVSTTGAPSWITAPPYKAADAYSPEHRGMIGDTEEVSRWKQQVLCTSIVVGPKTDGIQHCSRANTLGTYLDTNLKLAKADHASFLSGRDAASSATTPNTRQRSLSEVSAKTQIGGDSLVGDGCRIGDRCSVKRSVIGPHCTIGKNVKISDSVVMEHCTIEDKYVFTGPLFNLLA